MTSAVGDYTTKLNPEIKDSKLTSNDNEYFHLKMREMDHRRLKQKSECPTCGKLLSQRVLQFRHRCKCKPQPSEELTN